MSPSCFHHIRALRYIRGLLLLLNDPCKRCCPHHLSVGLRNVARVVACNRSHCSNLATLTQLHWLPVHDRIKFKIATGTYKAIRTGKNRMPPFSGPAAHSMQNSKVCLCQPYRSYTL